MNSRWDRVWALVATRDLGQRDLALDGLRALMILGMVWVNHGPPGGVLLAPFVHAPWHGWTLADLVFPGFLVAVGISIRFARRRVEGAAIFHGKVLRRFLLLQVLNVLLVNFPYYELAKLQWSGTLAMIGWCYLLVALCHRHTGWRAQAAIAVALVALQWLVYVALPVPGCPVGALEPQSNVALCVERLVFGSRHEEALVLLPALGALATTLIGVLAGHWLVVAAPAQRLTLGLLVAGVPMIFAGLAFDAAMPVNKALWTGTFTLLMAGFALVLLAVLRWAVQAGWDRALAPLQVAGANALFFYVFAQGLQRVLVYAKVRAGDGSRVRLGEWIYTNLVAPWAPGTAGTLVFTLTFLAVCYGAALVLHRHRIYFRV